MNDQSTDTVFMIRPFFFRMNEQTVVNNYYQKQPNSIPIKDLSGLVKAEFDEFVTQLRGKKIKVHVFQDTGVEDTPDSIFPNNWVSTSADGTIVLYPMFAPNRRKERDPEVIQFLKNNFKSTSVVDFSRFEQEGKFLEGTGSMVLDHINRLAFCALSERSSVEVLNAWTREMGYTPICFKSFQTVNDQRKPIYHTNVMMSVGADWAVVCLQAIDDSEERKQVLEALPTKKVIQISEEQCAHFCGNILEVKGEDGKRYIILSKTAFEAFNSEQKGLLEESGELIVVNLKNIEIHGGGSARCMIAEVFLTSKS